MNRKPNVERAYSRQIRAMLHAWQKYGLDAAQAYHLTRFRHKHGPAFKGAPSFENVVRGKIESFGMVRGHNDSTYQRYLAQFNILNDTR